MIECLPRAEGFAVALTEQLRCPNCRRVRGSVSRATWRSSHPGDTCGGMGTTRCLVCDSVAYIPCDHTDDS